MRKIEKEMLSAVHAKRDFRKDNTSVFFISSSESGNPNGSRAEVYLHGNHIANFWHECGTLEVNARTLAQWQTPTTKSRLRALGANVTTKKGQTFLDGQLIN
jgi:hypothetical protein